ncbi:MAG: phage late control D family protein [Spirochaetales bacterium]|nr:phage late control D family protein [Spirochaetales bacterium]
MSDSPAEIYTGRDFYVPVFEVKVMNRDLPGTVLYDVLSISYTDSLEEIDSFEITINNSQDIRPNQFKYIDGELRDLFFPGKDVEIYMGYINNRERQTERMLYGEITTLEPDFPSSGAATLEVRGLNIMHRLRDRQRTESYRNKKGSQIASMIAERLGIEIDIGENLRNEEEVDFLFQNNQYDILFLMERARTIGYELFVDPVRRVLVFQPSGRSSTVYNLEWGKSLISFKPTLTTVNQVSEVRVIGYNPNRMRRVVGRAQRRDMEVRALRMTRDIELVENAFTNREEIISDIPVYTRAQANNIARQELERIGRGMVKASGSTIGLPNLRAGTYVQINGLGDLFSGRFYITGTTHTINNSGYITKFEARKEERNDRSDSGE